MPNQLTVTKDDFNAWKHCEVGKFFFEEFFNYAMDENSNVTMQMDTLATDNNTLVKEIVARSTANALLSDLQEMGLEDILDAMGIEVAGETDEA